MAGNSDQPEDSYGAFDAGRRAAGGCNLRPTVPLMESLARGAFDGERWAYNGSVQRNHQGAQQGCSMELSGVQRGCPTQPSARTARMSDGTIGAYSKDVRWNGTGVTMAIGLHGF